MTRSSTHTNTQKIKLQELHRLWSRNINVLPLLLSVGLKQLVVVGFCILSFSLSLSNFFVTLSVSHKITSVQLEFTRYYESCVEIRHSSKRREKTLNNFPVYRAA